MPPSTRSPNDLMSSGSRRPGLRRALVAVAGGEEGAEDLDRLVGRVPEGEGAVEPGVRVRGPVRPLDEEVRGPEVLPVQGEPEVVDGPDLGRRQVVKADRSDERGQEGVRRFGRARGAAGAAGAGPPRRAPRGGAAAAGPAPAGAARGRRRRSRRGGAGGGGAVRGGVMTGGRGSSSGPAWAPARVPDQPPSEDERGQGQGGTQARSRHVGAQYQGAAPVKMPLPLAKSGRDPNLVAVPRPA